MLAQSPSFAFDLEFDSNRYGYGVTPSLIQMATTEACFVVDLMAGLDVHSLYALLADSRIGKLVHAPGEDLRLLHRLGCFPKNLFDTELVARLLNYEQTGLSALLEKGLGVHLSKGQQRSNWLLRPLSEAQIQYAAADVVWLHPLQEQLVAEAAGRGLMAFVQEEQALLSTTVFVQDADTDFLKPADRVHLSPWHQHLLAGLLRYRDDLARRLGRPAYQVMSKELIRELAMGHLSLEDIVKHPAVHPRYRNSRGVAAFAKCLRGSQTEAEAAGLSKRKPARPRATPAEYTARQKAAHDREQVFNPIQQALKDQFGMYATQFLMSNRLIGELISGSLRFDDLPAYRQSLFAETAKELGLNLSNYAAKPVEEKE